MTREGGRDELVGGDMSKPSGYGSDVAGEMGSGLTASPSVARPSVDSTNKTQFLFAGSPLAREVYLLRRLDGGRDSDSFSPYDRVEPSSCSSGSDASPLRSGIGRALAWAMGFPLRLSPSRVSLVKNSGNSSMVNSSFRSDCFVAEADLRTDLGGIAGVRGVDDNAGVEADELFEASRGSSVMVCDWSNVRRRAGAEEGALGKKKDMSVSDKDRLDEDSLRSIECVDGAGAGVVGTSGYAPGRESETFEAEKYVENAPALRDWVTRARLALCLAAR